MRVLILTLFLTAQLDPSWNLYNALNFFLIGSAAVGTAITSAIETGHVNCPAVLGVYRGSEHRGPDLGQTANGRYEKLTISFS